MLRFSSIQTDLSSFVRRVRVRHVTTLVATAALVAACSADKNYAERLKAWEDRQTAVRREGNSLPAPSNGKSDLATTCIRSCLPDPAPPPVDCTAIEDRYNVEFFPVPVWSFEPSASHEFAYQYDDSSVRMPDPQRIPMNRCGNASNQVYHIAGGPFEAWGGGIGTSISDWWRNATFTHCTGPGTPAPCESIPDELGLSGRTVDVSQWDGVSLWARRGPEGQAGIRVTVGDKTTDDDLNTDDNAGGLQGRRDDHIDTEQKWCKRSRRCDCPSNRSCVQGSCQFNGDPNDPAIGESNTCVAGAECSSVTPACEASACGANYATGVPDPAFQNKPCTPYQLLNGKTFSYCFDPATDPKPPEPYDLCGDHFQTPIRLTTEWQFFMVPFTGMRQQGYGKESPGLSPDQLSMVRLTWDGGYVDYYIDDVRFYRVKR